MAEAKSGIATLFPSFPKDMSVWERCKVTVKRHQLDYFKDWTIERMDEEDIPESWRPTRPLSAEDTKTHLKKNEVSRNKKLSFAIEKSLQPQENKWAARFRQCLEDGDIKTVTEAKDAAVLLWKTHSGQYDDRRAVHVPSLDGRGHRVKRSRRSDETERDYRQRLKASRPERAPDNNDIAATVMSMKEDINRIMSSKRAKLADSVEEREETLGLLRRHGPLEVRTVEEMKLAMVMTTVYERYTQMQ